MAEWGKWVSVVGGVIAVVGQFWGGPGMSPNVYLPAIGGVVAIVGGFLSE